MNTLSIDFGTSFCTASYINEAGTPCPVCFGVNQYNAKCYKIPTVIQYAISPEGDERKIIGEPALTNLIQSNSSNPSIISKIKTELRENSGYVVNGRPKKSVIIIADILSYIKELAEKDAGRIFNQLILTHPAQYEAIKVNLLQESASMCGFESVSFLEEPKAAAFAFVDKNNIPANKGAIVFDYGGGTIDIAYLWINSDQHIEFKFRPECKTQCGGEYIDMMMHNHFAPFFGFINGNFLSPILLDQCSHLKINFSFKEIQDLMLNNKVRTVSLDDFEDIIYPKVKVAIDLLSNVVDKCRRNDYSIDYVFLNGGSSRLRVVKRLIAELLTEATIIPYGDDDIAVAIGAQLSFIRNPQSSASRCGRSAGVHYKSHLDKIREQFKNSFK